MARRIILHIGSPKCGSTYLQRVMLQNAPALRTRGIHYPHDEQAHPGNAGTLNQINAEDLQQLFPEGVHTAVLSHEDLYGLPKRGDALSALVRDTDIAVHLLVFLRPFSEFVFGDYSQFMKQHFEMFLAERSPYRGQSFEEFAGRRIQNLKPATYLGNWQKRFPGIPLTLKSHRDIRPALEQMLGPDAIADWTLHRDHTNRSLRMIDCDRIVTAMYNPACSDAEIRDMFRRAFHKTDAPDPGRSLARTAWLEARFTSQNAELLTQFGYDNRLDTSPARLAIP